MTSAAKSNSIVIEVSGKINLGLIPQTRGDFGQRVGLIDKPHPAS